MNFILTMILVLSMVLAVCAANGGATFCNPPYSEISVWVQKAVNEAKKGKTVVLLIPSRTDTKWWHEYIMKAQEIRFIKGRLKFGGSKNSAPFPSAVVVFNPSPARGE